MGTAVGTGGLFRSGLPLSQEGVGYKLRGGQTYDHTPYLTSVDVIEALTGLDFLPNVSDDVEAEIESVVQVRLWD